MAPFRCNSRNKIPVAPLVDEVITPLASKGFEKITSLKINEKVENFRNEASPKLEKAKSMISGHTDWIFAVAGLVLLLLGTYFKNLLLCGQVMNLFLYSSLKTSFDELRAAILAAWGKVEKAEKDGDSTKKALKALSEEKCSDKVAAFAFQLFQAAAACHMVMHGGSFARAIIFAYALANGVSQILGELIDISGHDDVRPWFDKLLLLTLYVFFGSTALLLPSLALALNASLIGSQWVKDHGLKVAKLEGVEALKGPQLIPGLMLFGFLSFLILGGDNLSWYFKLPLLPAYFAECVLELL